MRSLKVRKLFLSLLFHFKDDVGTDGAVSTGVSELVAKITVRT